MDRFKKTKRDEKNLERENAIFWERVNRFLNPIQFCDINMPCTFRGQIAIKKLLEPKLEGNFYDGKILDVKKSYASPVMSGIIQTKLAKDFKTQFGDNFKNLTVDYMPIDFENKQLQLVNFNVSFYHGSVKSVRKRKKIRYRRKKPINRKSELLNDRFKDKTDSKVDETLEKKPDTIEPENEIKETIKNLDINDPEVKTGIVKRDLRKMGNIRKLSNTDVLGPLLKIHYIKHYEIVQGNTKIAIKDYFPENLKSSEPSPKFDKNLDYPAAWIFQDIFRWPSGDGFCPVESEDWEMLGKVVFIITLISGVLFMIVFAFCIYRSYETKIWEPERLKREEEEKAKERKGRGHQSQVGSQDTYIEQHDEDSEFFQLPESLTEIEKRDAIKLKNLNKKKRFGFEREKKELNQKEKNSEKMTKYLEQAVLAEQKERKERVEEVKQKLNNFQNLISNVGQGAQNVASNFQRGINQKSARAKRSLAQAIIPDVKYTNLKNESNASVSIMAKSPPKNELQPAMPIQENRQTNQGFDGTALDSGIDTPP